MAVLLNNITTADAYTDANTLGPVFDAVQLTILIANQSVLMEVMGGRYGADHLSPELLVTPSAFSMQRALGARFRSAIPGQPAQVIAIAWEADDPQPIGASAFTQSLAASGSITPGQASMQILRDGVLVGTEPNLNFLTTLGALTLTDDPGNQQVSVSGGFACARLADITLGSAAASIDFQNIPQTYAHLLLEVTGRSDVAATNALLLIRYNNDSGANYDWQYVGAQAGTTFGAESLAATSAFLGYLPGNTAPANAFGMSRGDIAGYAGTVGQKAGISATGLKTSVASGGLTKYAIAHCWRNTAAINRITLLPSGGNLVTGTRATLYGLA